MNPPRVALPVLGGFFFAIYLNANPPLGVLYAVWRVFFFKKFFMRVIFHRDFEIVECREVIALAILKSQDGEKSGL